MKIFQMKVVNIQRIIPQTVGIRKETIVHLRLPVSFFMVSNVVLHGKWSKVNNITLIAVSIVHPFCKRILAILEISSKSTKAPCDK